MKFAESGRENILLLFFVTECCRPVDRTMEETEAMDLVAVFKLSKEHRVANAENSAPLVTYRTSGGEFTFIFILFRNVTMGK